MYVRDIRTCTRKFQINLKRLKQWMRVVRHELKTKTTVTRARGRAKGYIIITKPD